MLYDDGAVIEQAVDDHRHADDADDIELAGEVEEY